MKRACGILVVVVKVLERVEGDQDVPDKGVDEILVVPEPTRQMPSIGA